MSKTVVISPGHGGWDPGSLAADGITEAVTNWQIAQALRTALERYDVAVLYTHEGADTALAKPGDLAGELKARAAVANNVQADLLISLHHDAASNPKARGASLWVWTKEMAPDPENHGKTKLAWLPAQNHHTDPKSHPIAVVLVKHVKPVMARYGIPWRNLGDPDGVCCANFGVLGATKGAALLIEIGFGTNVDDLAAMRNPEFIAAVADALAAGIAEALGLALREPIWDPVAEIAKLQERGIITQGHEPGESVEWSELSTVLNRILDRLEGSGER